MLLRSFVESPKGFPKNSAFFKEIPMRTNEFPILEYDENRQATLEPASMIGAKKEPPFGTDKLVICFFPEALKRLIAEKKLVPEREIPGEVPVSVYRFSDENVLLVPGQVGCPACAGDLDLFHAMGIRKVMFCGGGGVLDKNIGVGELLLVEGAIRDEGFSYHYLPPSREVAADPAVIRTIARYLDEHHIPYLRGKTWTTDAIFRETPERVRRRREEGAKIVEMEQAGCLAVAAFRGFSYGALIYGGDDVSGETWDDRAWTSRAGIRYDLILLCKELVKAI